MDNIADVTEIPTLANIKIETDTDGMVVIIDEKGRRLRLRETTFLDESRITFMVGADGASNPGFMNMFVFPSIKVAAIDENEFPMPRTFRELEGHIQRVDKHGALAVMQYMINKAQEEKESSAAFKEQAKN